MGDGGLRDGEGAESIIFDCSEGVPFHERHLFERGCMEDDLRLMLLEEMGDRVVIGDAAENGNVLVRACLMQAAVNLIKAAFRCIEEYQAGG